MNRAEFEALRNLPNKVVSDDIIFGPTLGVPHLRSFGGISIRNEWNFKVLVYGRFDARIPKVTFNFVLENVGPICRIDANGTNHRDVGRYHKHEIVRDTDPKSNLPKALKRDDLIGLRPREIWELVCRDALITHTGRFQDP